MKIVRAEVLAGDMPQSDPQWRFSIHANRISRGWLSAATGADGTIGYGYASATRHMGASSHGLEGMLEDFAPLVRGRDAFDIEGAGPRADAAEQIAAAAAIAMAG